MADNGSPLPPQAWSEALFKALTQHSGDIISLLDAEGRLLFNSPAAERISGFSREELAGVDTMQLMHPDDRPAVQRAFQGLLAEPGRAITVQYRYRTKAGGWTWMEAVACNRLQDPDVRGIVTSSRDISERKRAEVQLRALAARLQSVREEESARIARDLHDDLGQALTAQQLDLRWLEEYFEALPATPERGQIVDRLVAVRETSRRLLASAQRIAAGAWPVALEKLGLASALRQEARQFEARTGLPVAVEVQPAAEPAPGAPVGIAAFRIFQEALTNVARHAAARTVRVSLAREGGTLVLRVEDDGRGLPSGPEGAPPTLGILGMRERAQALGGELLVERRPAGGTAVTARLPC